MSGQYDPVVAISTLTKKYLKCILKINNNIQIIMLTKILQQLGLSPNEAKIYEALLDLNEAGVGAISSEAKIHRRNVYDAINRLIDKGLVFLILSSKENLYAPVDPDKLLELIKEKEVSLKKILPNLRDRYRKKNVNQEAFMYQGIEGLKNYMRDILRIGKDVYTIGANLCWLDPNLKTFTGQFTKEAKRKNIKFHLIYQAEVKTKENNLLKNFGDDYRFLPLEYNTNSSIDIFGDYVVSFAGVKFKAIDDNITIFILHDEQLANSYRTWFKFMWNMSEK